MRKKIFFALIFVSFFILSSCESNVKDADLYNSPALKNIDFSVKTDKISNKITEISGKITLGYTSSKKVDLKILDNNVVIYAETLSADKLEINFKKELSLIYQNENKLVVEVDYNDQYIKQNLIVNMPTSIKSFAVSTAQTTFDKFQADLTGEINFGYTSQNPAVLKILVSGKEVYSENIDVSKELKYPVKVTIPLMNEGENTIVASVTYGDTNLTKQFSVKVNSSIKSFVLTPASTSVDKFSVDVSGKVEFGYVSDVPAVFTVSVNGKNVYSKNLSVSEEKELTQDISFTLPLTDEGKNDVVATLKYGKNTLTQQFSVTLNNAITKFELAPKTQTTNSFEIELSGLINFGYTSTNPAVLIVNVNGKNIYSENIDVSSELSKTLDFTIPLTKEGSNNVVALLTYGKNTLTQKFSVTVDSAIKSFALAPESSAVSAKSVKLSGKVVFGHFSSDTALLEILDNGNKVYSKNLTVSKESELTQDLEFTIPLNDEGINTIVASISYGNSKLTQQFSVVVSKAITKFELAPLATSVNHFEGELKGKIDFGYLSQTPALLTVLVEGQEVYSKNIDVSVNASIDLDFPVKLLKEGENKIVAKLSYGDVEATQLMAISVNPAITTFTITPASTTVSTKNIQLTGSLTFGNYSNKDAVLTVFVDGKVAHKEVISVSKESELTHDFSFSIPLNEGENTIVAQVSYGSMLKTEQFKVTVNSAIASFTLTPASATSDNFSTSLSGKINFGYTSSNKAVFSVLVNGKEVYSEDIDVSSSLVHNIAISSIPLLSEGTNSIVGKVVYNGHSATQNFSVKIDSAIKNFILTTPSSTVNKLSAQISVHTVFGYKSSNIATLLVSVNGKGVYSKNIDVSSSLSSDIAMIIPLNEGKNSIVTKMTYNGHVATQSILVVVDSAIKSFSATPQATTVSVYNVNLNIASQFGFFGDNPANLLVTVNGKKMIEKDVAVNSASALTYSESIPLNLDVEGENVVVVTLAYGSVTQSKTFKVTVAPNAPIFSFPGHWASAFSPSEGMKVSGNATLTMDATYKLKEILLSVDNGEYLPQTFTDNNDGTFTVALKTQNPDIGTSLVTVKVVLNVNGREKTYFFNNSFSVDPVFNCNDPNSMSPTNDMIQDNKLEVRTLKGYFGKPDGGHSLTFVIKGISGGDTYTVEGKNIKYGFQGIETEFNVDKFRCGPGTCNVPYKLYFYVDGVKVCEKDNFGNIVNY